MKQDMKIYVSPGNKKLGDIASFSLPPHISCGPNQEYCNNKSEGLVCYASRMARLHPNIMKTWERNLTIVEESLQSFVLQMNGFLSGYNGERFRIHVGGDFVNQRYLDAWKKICSGFDNKRFMAYTKQNDLNYDDLPENLLIRYSLAPGQPVELPKGVTSKTWIANDNSHKAFRCPRSCKNCDVCWKEGHVFIKIH